MFTNPWHLFFVTIAFAACGGSQVGAGREPATATSVGFQLKLASSAASPAPFRAASDSHCDMGFAVTEASINVAEIAFKSPYGDCDMGSTSMGAGNGGMRMGAGSMMSLDGDPQTGHCRGDGLVVIEGPFRINLLTGGSIPALNDLTLFATTYEWVELYGMSVAARGTYNGMATFSSTTTNSSMATYSGPASHGSMQSFPVYIAMDIAYPPLRIQPVGGITIGTEGHADIQVAISSVDWFSSLDPDLSKCAAAPDAPFVGGVLQVTENTNTSCDAINGSLRENFLDSGRSATVVIQGK